MGSYLVRMKRTSSRKLSKCLPDLWDPTKIKKIRKITEIPENPGKYIPFKGLWVCCPMVRNSAKWLNIGVWDPPGYPSIPCIVFS